MEVDTAISILNKVGVALIIVSLLAWVYLPIIAPLYNLSLDYVFNLVIIVVCLGIFLTLGFVKTRTYIILESIALLDAGKGKGLLLIKMRSEHVVNVTVVAPDGKVYSGRGRRNVGITLPQKQPGEYVVSIEGITFTVGFPEGRVLV